MKSDHVHRWLERGTTAASCVLLSALAIAAVQAKILQYNNFYIHDWDTGIYFNVAWNIFDGDGFYSDVLRKNHLGEHFSPITALFAPIFFFDSSPIWLLAGQGLAVGATYVILYFVAVKILTDSAIPFARLIGLIFPVWAFNYSPLTHALLFEFHPSTLAVPLLAAAVLALLHGRNVSLWVLVGLLLLTKENAALGILGLAIYAGLVQNRLRLFAALCATAAVGAALIMGVIMPLFQSDDWGHYNRLGPFSLMAEKAHYLLLLFKGLAFLPLAAWRCLASAVPLVALNLSVKYGGQISMNFHYDDMASVFLLISAMHGLTVVVNLMRSRWFGWRLTAALLSIAVVAVLLVRPEAQSPLPKFRVHWQAKQARQLHQELAEYRRLPVDIGIAASSPLGPYLSARRRYVHLGRSRRIHLNTLRPGDLILSTPIRGGFDFAPFLAGLDASPGFTRVHSSPVLNVYRVLFPPQFPREVEGGN